MELPDYSNINHEELAGKIGLNAKHIPLLINSFLSEGERIMGELATAIEASDYEQMALHFHSLKGSSGNLKFDEMYELCKEAELAAKNNNSDFVYKAAYESLKKAMATIG